METMDLRGPSGSPRWYDGYLAYMASTPRNRVEVELEPLEQCQGHRLRIIDHLTKETPGYPWGNKGLWWTIMCLDGAPERVKYWIDIQHQSPIEATQLATPAEDRFRKLVVEVLTLPFLQPTVSVLGNWRDGVVLGYEKLMGAVYAAVRVHQECEQVNRTGHLPWTEQFHPRVGIGPSVRKAFSALLTAQRDQIQYVTDGRVHSLADITQEVV